MSEVQCKIEVIVWQHFLTGAHMFQEMFCSAACYQQAVSNYHSVLCQGDESDGKVQLIRHIIDLWRSVDRGMSNSVSFFLLIRSAHPPPETTSISLVLKLMAMLKQVTRMIAND